MNWFIMFWVIVGADMFASAVNHFTGMALEEWWLRRRLRQVLQRAADLQREEMRANSGTVVASQPVLVSEPPKGKQ